MQTTNPFPGMNPYLELGWSDVHTVLISDVRDALSERLPPDLRVVAEEAAMIGDANTADPPTQLRADVAVVKSETQLYVSSRPAGVPTVTETINVAVPHTIQVTRRVRWLEIRDTHHSLVTVIEILSPSNKTATGSARLALFQDELVLSGVNTIDIDLIRGGMRALPEEFLRGLKSLDETTYLIATGRAHLIAPRDVYDCPLRERLPAIAVPLRRTDKDVPLDLQPLVDTPKRKRGMELRRIPCLRFGLSKNAALSRVVDAAQLIARASGRSESTRRSYRRQTVELVNPRSGERSDE